MRSAALYINLRFVIFSAGWQTCLGTLPRARRLRMACLAAAPDDVLAMKRLPKPPPPSEAVPDFWGGVAPNWPLWRLPSPGLVSGGGEVLQPGQRRGQAA